MNKFLISRLYLVLLGSISSLLSFMFTLKYKCLVQDIMNSIVIYYLVYVHLHHCVAMYHKVRSKLFASEYPRCFIFERQET